MEYFEKPFGALATGETIWLYHLCGASGVEAEIISYGGILHRLLVPDKGGNRADVLLGADTLDAYVKYPFCPAAVIGRFANRISGGSYTWKGRTHQLDRNQAGNTLHGGSSNYANKVFTGKLFEEEGKAGVELYYRDTGIGGFPGEMDVWVTYTLSDSGTLEISYKAIPEEDTVINLTNHAYFNLAGHSSGPVDGQFLRLEADFYLPNDRTGLPLGEVLKVEGTDMDFRTPQPLKRGFESSYEQIAQFGGYDHNFCLRGREFREVAEASDPASGRVMKVFTDLPGVQLYTANSMPFEVPGKDGAVYARHHAFCLETQEYPNSPNQSQFPSSIRLAHQEYKTTTAFVFGVSE